MKKNFQNLDSSGINKNRIYIQNEKPPKLDHQTGMPYPGGDDGGSDVGGDRCL